MELRRKIQKKALSEVVCTQLVIESPATGQNKFLTYDFTENDRNNFQATATRKHVMNIRVFKIYSLQ